MNVENCSYFHVLYISQCCLLESNTHFGRHLAFGCLSFFPYWTSKDAFDAHTWARWHVIQSRSGRPDQSPWANGGTSLGVRASAWFGQSKKSELRLTTPSAVKPPCFMSRPPSPAHSPPTVLWTFWDRYYCITAPPQTVKMAARVRKIPRYRVLYGVF